MKEATPLEPVTAVLDAFRAHRLVALDEGDHNNLQGYAFRMALIHHPEFAGLVNDIVVEAGNSLYQDVMDKFVAGEDVPYDALRRVWQNTTQPHDVWDKPIYEEFYRAVRALDSGCPRNAGCGCCWAIPRSIGPRCIQSPIFRVVQTASLRS